MKGPRLLWSFALGVALTLSAVAFILHLHPAPARASDFTVLKRDLLELDQTLRYGISQGTGLHQPERFVLALEQLERDYRLNQAQLDSEGRLVLDSAITCAVALRLSAAAFAPYASFTLPHNKGYPKERWESLQRSYARIAKADGQTGKTLPLIAVDILESKEHPPAP